MKEKVYEVGAEDEKEDQEEEQNSDSEENENEDEENKVVEEEEAGRIGVVWVVNQHHIWAIIIGIATPNPEISPFKSSSALYVFNFRRLSVENGDDDVSKCKSQKKK